MKIHHINAATMCPRLGALVNERRHMVCHCLVVETRGGLVLVDTGIGTGDIANPVQLGKQFNWLTRPRFDPAETAKARIAALGFDLADVKHVAVTHLDLDHAGGLPDFPDAEVHVHATELEAARARATSKERGRYRPAHWAHGPRWTAHPSDGGETWYGFEHVRAIAGTDDEILLVPLHGHTRGHCGIAVREGDRWLLHCGDAYFYHREMDPERPRCTFGLRVFQRLVEIDREVRLANQARLRELRRDHGGEIALFSAHDPVEFESFAAPADRG